MPARALAVVLAVVLTAGGCSGDDEPEGGPNQAAPSDGPTLEVEPVTELGKVTGALPRKEAAQVRDRVSRVTVDWLSEAYVGGDYPRRDFDGAFAGFSKGARELAVRDAAVMTNRAIGRKVDGVTPQRIAVTVDLLAVRRRAVGATARVLTTFRAEGEGRAAGLRRIAGRLHLTKAGGRWKVFGYHVTNGGR